MNKQINIYGDGRQVRDALHVDDLTDLYCKFINSNSANFSQAYNVGGGHENSISILEFIDMLKILQDRVLNISLVVKDQEIKKYIYQIYLN